jgi:hypothetical protein
MGGCNGSGKTSVARALLDFHKDEWKPLPLLPGRRKPAGYRRGWGGGKLNEIVVLGSYETTCGGMDTISDKAVRHGLVEGYAAQGRLLFFEGLITGKTYGWLGELSERPGHKGRWIYTYMNTPFDVCVARVLQRRKERGNDAPFDPARTMASTFKGVQSAARRAGEAGHKVLWLDYRLTPRQLAHQLLKEAGRLANAQR